MRRETFSGIKQVEKMEVLSVSSVWVIFIILIFISHHYSPNFRTNVLVEYVVVFG